MPRTRRAVNAADNGHEASWSIPSLREPRYSQSLERGLAILGAFTAKRPVLGIADIADELGMSRSTTHRYVITLVELGYLEQGASRKYRLGLRVTDLGMAALGSTGLPEQAHPLLEELRRRTSYAAAIAVLDGEDVLVVDRARTLRRTSAASGAEPHPGVRLPVHASAAGKLLLASLTEAEQRALLAKLRLGKHGPRTITAKKALRSELERTAKAGLAIEDEELAAGQYAIAAPVRDESGEVTAAVTLSAPSSMITLKELRDALGPHLRAVAAAISARLGYRRADERP
jgi:IclR family pca regulon transcriptional regulator